MVRHCSYKDGMSSILATSTKQPYLTRLARVFFRSAGQGRTYLEVEVLYTPGKGKC